MTNIDASGFEHRTTGRKLVVLRQDASPTMLSSVLAGTQLQVVVASDFGGSVPPETLETADCVLLDRLNVMIAAASPAATAAVSALETEGYVLAVEDEGFVYALPSHPLEGAQQDYLEGYRDGVIGLVDQLLGEAGAPGAGRAGLPAFGADGRPGAAPGAQRPERAALGWREGGAARPGRELRGPEGRPLDQAATWGLLAVGADRSPFSGRGVRVAILDTGLDLNHPDFRDRSGFYRSFVPRETIQDGNGHGTHTAGTAAGPRTPWQPPRYGVAYEAELYIGKVLSNGGSGQDAWILNGINWALENGCRVISMSLGSIRPPMEAYRAAGERALDSGAIIVAAAGNDSRRSEGRIEPTTAPANSSTIIAVAALDQNLRVANFSNSGKIEIAAPGVGVRSAWPMPRGYNEISGTSMATPHVAGVVASLMQAEPHLDARQVWRRLLETARRLDAPRADVGVGLVQAPLARAVSERPAPKQGPFPKHGQAPTQGQPSEHGQPLEHGQLPKQGQAPPIGPPHGAPIGRPGGEPGTGEAERIEVLVILKKEHLAAIQAVVARLIEAGMTVKSVLRTLGAITGTVPASKVDLLRAIEGVAVVEKGGIHHTLPPEADAR